MPLFSSMDAPLGELFGSQPMIRVKSLMNSTVRGISVSDILQSVLNAYRNELLDSQ